MFTLYILYSAELDKYYIGCTSIHVSERLKKHLADHNGFTAKAKDWCIAYTESFSSKQGAIQREKQLKAWKNALRIKALIERSSTQ